MMSPGIYQLEDTLMLRTNGQVLLGLGIATLVPTHGTAAVTVAAGTTGVRVAGLLLQAGTVRSDTLLMWEGHGEATPTDSDHGFIHDVFARVGGPRLPPNKQAMADSMMRIDASGVVGDNMWLWRADHSQGGELVENGANPCFNGLIVNGDDVTMYAIAAEHTLEDVLRWNGERGKSFFFQAELPCPPLQTSLCCSAESCLTTGGLLRLDDVRAYPYAGYAVSSHVKEHQAVGVGVYHFFRDHPVTVQSGITCPRALESSFVDPFGVFLNGKGTMMHILNDKGVETKKPGGTGAGESES